MRPFLLIIRLDRVNLDELKNMFIFEENILICDFSHRTNENFLFKMLFVVPDF